MSFLRPLSFYQAQVETVPDDGTSTRKAWKAILSEKGTFFKNVGTSFKNGWNDPGKLLTEVLRIPIQLFQTPFELCGATTGTICKSLHLSERSTVLLSGATGLLSSYLAQSLLASMDPDKEKEESPPFGTFGLTALLCVVNIGEIYLVQQTKSLSCPRPFLSQENREHLSRLNAIYCLITPAITQKLDFYETMLGGAAISALSGWRPLEDKFDSISEATTRWTSGIQALYFQLFKNYLDRFSPAAQESIKKRFENSLLTETLLYRIVIKELIIGPEEPSCKNTPPVLHSALCTLIQSRTTFKNLSEKEQQEFSLLKSTEAQTKATRDLRIDEERVLNQFTYETSQLRSHPEMKESTKEFLEKEMTKKDPQTLFV